MSRNRFVSRRFGYEHRMSDQNFVALPFIYTFTSGAIAGMSEPQDSNAANLTFYRMYRVARMTTCLHSATYFTLTFVQLLYPLDVVKTRQQLDTTKGGTGMMQTFKHIVSQEG